MSDKIFDSLRKLIKESVIERDDADVGEILKEIGAPTASIAVLDDGDIVAECISTENHNVDTVFQACSISKAMCGLALMRLTELGHFALEDKICDRLPPAVVRFITRKPKNERHVRQITIKHLMSHTAGISVHGFPGYADHENVPTIEQIIKADEGVNTQEIQLVTLPGLEFMYSGGGITLLQCMAEHVMQMPFADLMRKILFEPLGMTRSFYHLASDELNVPRAHHTGYTPCESRFHVQPELGAAGLWTTPSDLLKAIRGVQESLEGKTDSILRQATAQKMLTVVKFSMGLSWFATASGFGHSGDNLPGWTCIALGYADLPQNIDPGDISNPNCNSPQVPKNCGISIMTNSRLGDRVYLKIVHAIAYLKGWSHAPFFYGTQQAIVPFASTGSMHDVDLLPWIGRNWSNGWYVAENKDGLVVAGIEGLDGDVVLRPAAIAPKQYENGKKRSVDLVLEDRQLMLRLGWEESEAIIEVWNGSQGVSKILRREKTA